MNVFLTGISGQLGRALVPRLVGHVLIAPSQSQSDVTSASVVDVIARAEPDVVIHAAAYTDVDGAEAHPDLAFAVNAHGSRPGAGGAGEAERRVVEARVGSPTSASDLASAIVSLLAIPCAGVYHAVNSGTCSWYVFASEILALSGLERRVVPISSAELKRPAPRPANS